MQMKVTLTKDEADRIIGDAIASRIAVSSPTPGAPGLRVESVDWRTYGSNVEVTLTDARGVDGGE